MVYETLIFPGVKTPIDAGTSQRIELVYFRISNHRIVIALNHYMISFNQPVGTYNF
jgi:hypothetical protein